MVDLTVLTMVRDIVTIIGVIVAFTYYVLTVRASQKSQKHQLETRQAQLFSQYHLRFNEDFEEKMRKILSGNIPHHEAFARVLFDFHAYAGEYSGIEIIEVRGKGSDLALVERMNQLKPEINIRWVPLIKMDRMLEI